MASVIANNTAAFILYGGNWNDSSDEIRTTSTLGSNMFLEFDGTTLSAFGKFDPRSANFMSLVDGQPRVGNITLIIQPSVPTQPFLEIQNLSEGHHNITLSLINGVLGLTQIVWYNPQASAVEGSPIGLTDNPSAVQTSGQWDFNRSGTGF
ncbi:hypothetical protein FRC06_009103, partial [Ceratobasidium sp. 370]